MNTASSLRSFVDKMRQQQKLQKDINGGNKSYFAVPLYSRYVGNTGTGDDNVVQPEKPVAAIDTDKGERSVHEGEDVYKEPDGELSIVPAGRNSVSMQKAKKMPGYQFGGTNINIPGKNAPVFKPIEQNQPQQFKVNQPSFKQPIIQPGSRTESKIEQPAVVTPQPGTAPIFQKPLTDQAAAIQTTPTTTTATDVYNKALGRMSENMNAGSPAYQAQAKKYLEDLKRTSAAKEQIAGFQSKQEGVSPEVAAARQAMGRAVSGQQLAGAEAQAATGAMQTAEQAAVQAGQLALQGKQMEFEQAKDTRDFEESKRRFGISTGQWQQEFNEGKIRFNTQTQQWERTFALTSQQVNFDQAMRMKDFDESVRRFGINQDQWKQEFEQGIIRFNTQTQQWERQFELTSQQVNFDQAMRMKDFAESIRRFDITQDQWQQEFNEGKIRFNTQTQQWERTFSANQQQVAFQQGWQNIQNLMATDPYMGQATIDNINKIAKGLGINFDAAALARSGQQNQLNDAMKLISNGIASNMSSDEIRNTLKAAGLDNLMNQAFSGGGLDKLLGNLSTNSYDRALNDLTSSQAFQSLTPDQQKQFKTIATAMLLGGGTGMITVDANGNIAINPNAATGGAGSITAAGKQQGEVFIQNGTAYKVGTQGTATPISINITDPAAIWSSDADKVIKAGREGNNLYDQLVEARANDIVENNNYNKLSGVSEDDPLYQNVFKNMPAYNPAAEGWEIGQYKKVKQPNGTYILVKMDSKTTSGGHRTIFASSPDGKVKYQIDMNTLKNNEIYGVKII